MRFSAEFVRTIVEEWMGQELSEEDSASLATAYETLSRELNSCPEDRLRWVEPALRSVPGPNSPRDPS